MTCEPILMRPQWGAFGRAAPALSASFVHPLAIDRGIKATLGLSKALLPARGTRKLSKSDMLWNDACPSIRVDPQTFDVFVDGETRDLRAGARAAAWRSATCCGERHAPAHRAFSLAKGARRRRRAHRHRRAGRFRQDRADRAADPDPGRTRHRPRGRHQRSRHQGRRRAAAALGPHRSGARLGRGSRAHVRTPSSAKTRRSTSPPATSWNANFPASN